jgi:hypothetical protein
MDVLSFLTLFIFLHHSKDPDFIATTLQAYNDNEVDFENLGTALTMLDEEELKDLEEIVSFYQPAIDDLETGLKTMVSVKNIIF